MKIFKGKPQGPKWKRYLKFIIPYFVVLFTIEISVRIILEVYISLNVQIIVDLTFLINFIGVVIVISLGALLFLYFYHRSRGN